MAEPLRFLADFLFTGPWSRVWPFVALPLLAFWAMRRALDRLETAGDPRRQARLAALAACVPGVITLGLSAHAAFGFRPFAPESLDCYVKLLGPVVLAGVALARSGGGLAARRLRLGRVLKHAGPPSPRLARLAGEIGVPVREVDVDASICFVSGFRRPAVVVSAGALAALSDAEIRAALLHERAHLRHRDGLWTTAVTAVAEFCLFSSRRALRLYRAWREALADDEAARHVGRTEVAGVLVRFARSAARLPVPSSLAEPDGLARRVRRLVGPPDRPEHGGPRATAAFAFAAALALYPLLAVALERFVFRCRP
jgi:hypothetical protein